MTDYKNLIDGKMVDNGQWLEVLNPATEEVIGQAPVGDTASADAASAFNVRPEGGVAAVKRMVAAGVDGVTVSRV